MRIHCAADLLPPLGGGSLRRQMYVRKLRGLDIADYAKKAAATES
jgi:hypothetical protein